MKMRAYNVHIEDEEVSLSWTVSVRGCSESEEVCRAQLFCLSVPSCVKAGKKQAPEKHFLKIHV